MKKINLGDVVRDTISGFSGVVMGRFEYLFGCVRCQVNPMELREGKPIESQIFDEGQLEIVLHRGLSAQPKESTGGPREDDYLARR